MFTSIKKANSNTLYFMAMVIAAFLFQSFVTPTPPSEKMNIKKSQIVWKAYKVAGSHVGTLGLQSGNLTFNDGKLTGGNFVIDMTTIACTNLEGEYKGKLEGHLKSGDFFAVDQHTTAALDITKVKRAGKNSYKVTGDLTIKGIKKSIVFDASVYGKKATATLKVDRTNFGIKYGSGSFFEDLQDNLIYDEFDLVIDLEF